MSLCLSPRYHVSFYRNKLFLLLLLLIDASVQAVRRAFYGLQSSGMCEGRVSPVVSAHRYKVAIQPVLTYGCSTLNVSPCIIDLLDKYQAKLFKSNL